MVKISIVEDRKVIFNKDTISIHQKVSAIYLFVKKKDSNFRFTRSFKTRFSSNNLDL
jgi:hypothetical protein